MINESLNLEEKDRLRREHSTCIERGEKITYKTLALWSQETIKLPAPPRRETLCRGLKIALMSSSATLKPVSNSYRERMGQNHSLEQALFYSSYSFKNARIHINRAMDPSKALHPPKLLYERTKMNDHYSLLYRKGA